VCVFRRKWREKRGKFEFNFSDSKKKNKSEKQISIVLSGASQFNFVS
jgi:hypothetical protein